MIENIRLQNFRSYNDSTFIFAQGVNIIIGANGSGKTNLLEALLVISTGSSYRAKDAELVMHKKNWARIDAKLLGSNRTIKYSTHGDTVKKALSVNGEVISRITDKKKTPVVLFEPNHLQLFSLGPENRRDYLDDLLEITNTHYGQIRRLYRRNLAQRNRLLKINPPNLKDQLFVWNIRLSELGGQIAEYRRNLLIEIDAELPSRYASISKTKTPIRVLYSSKIGSEQYSSQLLQKLENNIAHDVARGFTAHGPHRDDMQILLDGHPIQDSASRGEVRTLMLALKMVELGIIEKHYGQKAIFLLDDVFSELDATRRKALTTIMSGHQTFITTTDADVVAKSLETKCRTIKTSGY